MWFKKQLKLCLAIFILSLSTFYASAQQEKKIDKVLIQKIQEKIKGFHGDAGVYLYNLKTGQEAGVKADTIFPTASTIKVPIFCKLSDKIDKGELSYRKRLTYHTSKKIGGSGIMKFFKDGTKVRVSTLATLMIIFSDNTASFWCQELAGGGAEINRWLAAHGFKDTRVNSRTPGRRDDYSDYGWGQTTPREMATLMVDITQNKILTPAACDRMYRTLTYQTHDRRAMSEIPPYIQRASKTGGVSASRSEIMLVSAPHGDYVLSVFTKNNKDKSWKRDNEAQELIRQISALAWHYFEPDSDWQPPLESEKFRY